MYDVRLIDSAGNETIVQRFIKYPYITDGLLAYYDGECNIEDGHSVTTNIWKDLSGNNNDATMEGLNFTEISGWKEKSIQLDGDDDRITFPVQLPVAGTFSIEIVFTEQNYEKIMILVSDKGWNAFYVHTWNSTYGGKDYEEGSIFIGGNYNEDKDRFIPDEINYRTTIEKTDSISYTYNGSTKQATFYVNGKKIAQKNFVNDPEEIEFFEIYSSQKEYKKISFYNKVLTQEEVTQNYEIDKYRFGITE